MQPETSIGIRPWQWVATIVIVVILIALGIYAATRGSGTTDDDQVPVTQTPAAETNRLIVTDQFPGNIVYVSTVQLAADGFVVIHKDNNGTPGAVIGSVYFPKGIGPAKITLTESTLDGSTYYAMLHTDTGADKKFAEATDAPIKDSRGMVIMKAFKARADIVEPKG